MQSLFNMPRSVCTVSMHVQAALHASAISFSQLPCTTHITCLSHILSTAPLYCTHHMPQPYPFQLPCTAHMGHGTCLLIHSKCLRPLFPWRSAHMGHCLICPNHYTLLPCAAQVGHGGLGGDGQAQRQGLRYPCQPWRYRLHRCDGLWAAGPPGGDDAAFQGGFT